MNELKRQSLFGSFWIILERFGYLFIQFISNIVLARLLTPADFGTIAILTVFILLSNIFVDSGFGAALIQKKNISDGDKSTVFYINLIIAFFVYLVIFTIAPIAQDYFKDEDLSLLLRVLSIVVIIDSFSTVQNTLLIKKLQFKTVTLIKIFSILIAATCAILAAYNGLGIWSLVLQYVIYSIIRGLSIWIKSNWKPSITFKKSSARQLFGFGSKILLTSIIAELYLNFQQIMIGHYFKASDLGYYSQARQLQNIPSGSITQMINSVAFPVYSRIQDDNISLKNMYIENLKILSFLNTPLMVLLALIGGELIVLIYSTKWIGSINYFKFLCLTLGIFTIMHNSSRTLFKAMGKGDWIYKIELIKSVIGITLMIVLMKTLGIWGILISLALVSILEIFINGYFVDKSIDQTIWNQLSTLLPYFGISIGCAAIVLSLIYFVQIENPIIIILIKTAMFAILYIISCKLFKMYGYVSALKLLRAVKNRIL